MFSKVFKAITSSFSGKKHNGGTCPVITESAALRPENFPEIIELNSHLEEQTITLFLSPQFDKSLLPIKADSSRGWWEQDSKAKNHARFCLPLTMASSLGYYILSPATFTVEWDGEETHDTKVTILDAASHAQIDNHSTHGGFTVQARFVVRTKNPGDFVYVKGVANQYRLPYIFLDAMIEAWWTPADFGLVALLNQPGKFTINKGEPIAQMFVINSTQAQYRLASRREQPPRREEWDESSNARILSGTGKNFHYLKGVWPDQTSVCPHFKSWSKDNTNKDSNNIEGNFVAKTSPQQLLELGQKYRHNKPAYAEELLTKAVRLAEEETDDQLLLANCFCALALVYDDLRYLEESEVLLKKAVKIRENNLGRNHPETLTALNWQACIMTHAQKYKQSEQLFREVIESREHVLGKDHFDVANSIADLGFVYKETGRFDAAKAHFQRAISIVEKNDQYVPQLAQFLEFLAFLYKEFDQPSQAEETFLRLLEIRNKSPENEKEIVKVLLDLAFLYKQTGKDKDAENKFNEAVYLTEKYREVDPLYVAHNLEYLAFFYQDSGNWIKAIPIFEQVLELKSQALKKGDGDLLGTVRVLADIYKNQGKNELLKVLRDKYDI